MEVERYRAIQEIQRESDIEKLRCIEETKRKQWCAMCRREAKFYCCWNTAYCDYPCQQKHWATHMNTCAQKSKAKTVDTTVVSTVAATTIPVATLANSTVKIQQQHTMPKLVINTNHSSLNSWRA